MKSRISQMFSFTTVIILTACTTSQDPASPTLPPTLTSTNTLLPSPTLTDTPIPSATSTDTPLPPTSTLVPTATQPEGRRGLLAYVYAEGDLGGIRVIQADGKSGSVILSDHPSIDSRPSWSPDGKQIAFESGRDDPINRNHMAIFIMNSDGSLFTRVTDEDAWYSQPDWSPDGKRIALTCATSRGAGDSDLCVLDLNAKKITKLTDGPANDIEPSWAPDSSQISFASNRNGVMNIFTIIVETGEITQLTQESGDNNHPDWSLDGKKILFVSNRDGDEDIYIMDANGANQTRLIDAPGRDVDPEWSPDGDYFAYGHQETGGRKIYVSDLIGSPPELLFELPDQATAGHPAWSVKQELISIEPVIGPPFCMRDTDGDFEPDMVSTTFSTEDIFAFIAFPYDNMQDGMGYETEWETPGEISISIQNVETWDGGEEGFHFSYSTLQHTPGMISAKLYLEGKLMQEIECEVVQP